jgi:hemoglobin
MSQVSSQNSLYELIGPAFIKNAVAEFYRRAFDDVMIGHFFFQSDITHITSQQTNFVTAMLGGPLKYSGKSLRAAHAPFAIRPAHFARRQVLMREVLTDLGLKTDLINAWLDLEDQFKPVILTEPTACL